MSEDLEYHSLENALIAFDVPTENRAFLSKISAVAPLARFVRTSGYIRADRADGGPSLNIAYGWTNGFVSEQEVRDIFGDVEAWPSGRRGLWFVWHPENRGGKPRGGSAGADRIYEICPRCFIEMPPSGVCDRCES